MFANGRSLVSGICLLAMLAANTHANLALAGLFAPRRCAHAVPVTDELTQTETCGCKSCAKKAKPVADPITLNQRTDCPCNSDGSPWPCCPHCPCPGGCATCSVAKTLAIPILLTLPAQADCTETLQIAGDNHHVLTCATQLYRPPRA